MFETKKSKVEKREQRAIRKKRKKNEKEAFRVEPPKKRSKKWLLIPFFIVLSLVLVYFIAKDNSDIYVNNVTITHSQLPDEFNGFKILQISDIHGEYFGEMQSRLLEVISSLEYDIVLFTGDYLKAPGDDDVWCILDIIDGLKKAGKEDIPMYYILGERDYAYSGSGEPSEDWNICIEPKGKNSLMEQMEKKGVEFVYPIQQITKGDASIYLTGIKYYEEIFDEYNFDTDKDFSICVTHKPITYNVNQRLETANANRLTEVDYDVSISGHTMGGIYRLPYLGALYIEGVGILPQEKYAYGVNTVQGRVNFISSGLGNGPDAFFRLCNTPEVAIITLTNSGEE